MKRSVGIVLVTFLAFATVGAGTAAATFPGADGNLVFWIDERSPSEIVSIDPNGTNRTVLVSSARRNYATPAWSADGEKIAYVSQGSGPDRLMTMNADGTNRTVLMNSRRRPLLNGISWSPDGTQIAASAFIASQHQFQIVVVNVDSSGFSVITTTGDNYEPDWSPDGTRIVFERWGQLQGIRTIDPNGTDPTPVIHLAVAPSWSPDGSLIAFTRPNTGFEDDELYVIAPNGTGFAQLTDSPNRFELAPAFSPDGTRIAFSRTVANDIYAPNDIWVMDVDGTDAVRVTDTPKVDELGPSWQPILAGRIGELAAAPHDRRADPRLTTHG